MALFRHAVTRCPAQCLQYTHLHLGCSFASKSNREYLLGMFHCGKQSQISLNQKLRFTGSGWRLDDKRPGNIQGRLAGRGVIVAASIRSVHVAAPRND